MPPPAPVDAASSELVSRRFVFLTRRACEVEWSVYLGLKSNVSFCRGIFLHVFYSLTPIPTVFLFAIEASNEVNYSKIKKMK